MGCGQAQQGFTRFSPATGDLTAPGTPAAPSAVARAGDKVSVYVQAPLDLDDINMTVRLYRDALAQQADMPEALLNMRRILESHGKTEEARSCWSTAL